MAVSRNKVHLTGISISDNNLGAYFSSINDPEVNRFLECRHFPQTMDSVRDYIQKMNESPNDVLFKIYAKEENFPPIYVGNIRLGPIDWVNRFADVGLIIWKGQWGQGYGTEAIKLVSEYAFSNLNLHALKAGILEGNEASVKAFEKAGFIRAAIVHDLYWLDGKWVNNYIYVRHRE